MIKKISIAAFFFLLTMQANAQMVAVKTDVVKDAFMIPNIGVEIVLGDKHTLGADLFGTKKIYGNVAEIIGVTPRYRYWLSGRPFSRLFVGANAQFANYTINWEDKSYHGNSFAVGLALGYSINLSKRFNIELAGGTDLLYYNHKQYTLGDIYTNYGEKPNAAGVILCPRLEISVMYLLR